MRFFLAFIFLFVTNVYSQDSCSPADMPKGDESGYARIEHANGDVSNIYWTKFKSLYEVSQGTVFYLAGGPISHFMYLTMAQAFQRTAYPNYDVVLYDYLGVNCSDLVTDLSAIAAHPEYYSMQAMASDFIALKEQLIGDEKAVIMGGSHGSMLGSQIVHLYPEHIEKAILFSGDTETGWLETGWQRFDELLYKMSLKDPNFAKNLNTLIKMAQSNKLSIKLGDQKIYLSRQDLEVTLWFTFGQSALAQTQLPAAVQLAVIGIREWLANAYLSYIALLQPFQSVPLPTAQSAITTFHRCNVWFPQSHRELAKLKQPTEYFLSFASFVGYWDQLCQKYNDFGEFTYDARRNIPTDVPVLFWVGNQDYFDPIGTEERLSQLTNNLEFHMMEGWSHDFGTDEAKGFSAILDWIRAFLAVPL